jgi:hypothetical protein
LAACVANERRGWRQSNASGIGILAALFNPSLDFGEIPDDTARSQIETAGELTPLFHLVDGRVGEQRHQQSEFVATDRSSRAIPHPWRCRTFAWMRFVKLPVGQVDSRFDTVCPILKCLAELAFGDVSHDRSPMTGGKETLSRPQPVTELVKLPLALPALILAAAVE